MRETRDEKREVMETSQFYRHGDVCRLSFLVYPLVTGGDV